jgi:hypothetical protein
MAAAGAGGMTATTTGLTGQQQTRLAVLSARQSVTGAPAAGRWRSARWLQAADCYARSGPMITSLPHTPGRSPGSLLPGQQAQRPETPGLPGRPPATSALRVAGHAHRR